MAWSRKSLAYIGTSEEFCMEGTLICGKWRRREGIQNGTRKGIWRNKQKQPALKKSTKTDKTYT